jgi:hypothetical protein
VPGRLAIQVQRASLQHIPGRHVAVGTTDYHDSRLLFNRLKVVERSAKRDSAQFIMSQTM